MGSLILLAVYTEMCVCGGGGGGLAFIITLLTQMDVTR